MMMGREWKGFHCCERGGWVGEGDGVEERERADSVGIEQCEGALSLTSASPSVLSDRPAPYMQSSESQTPCFVTVASKCLSASPHLPLPCIANPSSHSLWATSSPPPLLRPPAPVTKQTITTDASARLIQEILAIPPTP